MILVTPRPRLLTQIKLPLPENYLSPSRPWLRRAAASWQILSILAEWPFHLARNRALFTGLSDRHHHARTAIKCVLPFSIYEQAVMSPFGELADRPADVTLSQPKVLASAYRDYHRYRVTIRSQDAPPVSQERDVLIAGKVVVVMPVDVARQEIVLIRQFRLPAHLANGRGDLIEFVAGRVEPNETLVDAARRECREEIGVVPEKTLHLLSYLTTPGLTDEEVSVFLGAVDAAAVRDGPRTTPDGERLHVGRMPIEDAIRALDHGAMHGSPVVIGLQWLALNREQLPRLLRRD